MSYQSWSVVFGEQPSAAKWNILGTNDSAFNDGTGIANIEIGSGHTSMKLDYKFGVYRNSAWSVSSSLALMQFDTKEFDTSTNIDVATNKGRFTAPVAGFYVFLTTITAAQTLGQFESLLFYKNGSAVKQLTAGSPDASVNAASSGSALLSLSANDYVEVYYQGTNLAAGVTGQIYTWFQGFLLSQT